jgi:hypothetical protein
MSDYMEKALNEVELKCLELDEELRRYKVASETLRGLLSGGREVSQVSGLRSQVGNHLTPALSPGGGEGGSKKAEGKSKKVGTGRHVHQGPVSEDGKRIWDAVRARVGTFTPKEIAEELGLKPHKVNSWMWSAQRNGKVNRIGWGKFAAKAEGEWKKPGGVVGQVRGKKEEGKGDHSRARQEPRPTTPAGENGRQVFRGVISVPREL